MSKDGVVLGFFPRTHGVGISGSSSAKLAGTHCKGVGRSFHCGACLWGAFYIVFLGNAYPNKFFKHRVKFHDSFCIFRVSGGNFSNFWEYLNIFWSQNCYTPLLKHCKAGRTGQRAILKHMNNCTLWHVLQKLSLDNTNFSAFFTLFNFLYFLRFSVFSGAKTAFFDSSLPVKGRIFYFKCKGENSR